MNGFFFPGQGSQFVGMGKEQYDQHDIVKDLFHRANEILGFNITEMMFFSNEETLKQTNIAQPSIFLHSMAILTINKNETIPSFVAGHSLGEFSALASNNICSVDDCLQLIQIRAEAMQKACINHPGTMAAILGLSDDAVEDICNEIDEIVVPANYNSPGQLVISGTIEGIKIASEKMLKQGALKVVPLQVGGAFHSPLMESARQELATAIEKVKFHEAKCPIFQNTDAQSSINLEEIKKKLLSQLTAPVRWTQTMQNMILAGMSQAIEVGGQGNVLRGLLKRLDRNFPSLSMS